MLDEKIQDYQTRLNEIRKELLQSELTSDNYDHLKKEIRHLQSHLDDKNDHKALLYSSKLEQMRAALEGKPIQDKR